MSESVKVPVGLLLTRELPASAKVVWLALQLLGPVGPTAVQVVTGLSRTTIGKGLDHLKTMDRSLFDGPAPVIPGELLQNPEVQPQAKLLYATLQLSPGFKRPSGQFTYAGLSQLTGLSLPTLREGARALRDAGWLALCQRNRESPIQFSLANPAVDLVKANLARIRRRIRRSEHKGEAIMREWLNLTVDSSDYEDGAYFGGLKNPYTGEPLQLDRFYRAGVAFEFQGPQHFGATAKYSQDEAHRQQARDFIKAGFARQQGITVQIVLPVDLTLGRIRSMVDGLLPMRSLQGMAAVISLLESESQWYREAAKRWPEYATQQHRRCTNK